MGEDTAHRYHLGKTRMQSPIRRDLGDDYGEDEEEDEGGWRGPYGAPRVLDESGKSIITAHVSNMNGRIQHIAQPGGRQGIGSGLELLMRLAGLFKFESQGRLRYDTYQHESQFEVLLKNRIDSIGTHLLLSLTMITRFMTIFHHIRGMTTSIVRA